MSSTWLECSLSCKWGSLSVIWVNAEQREQARVGGLRSGASHKQQRWMFLALFSEQTLVQWDELTTFPNVHVGHASTVAGVHLDDYTADVAAAGSSESTMRYRNIKSDMTLTFRWLPVQATPTRRLARVWPLLWCKTSTGNLHKWLLLLFIGKHEWVYNCVLFLVPARYLDFFFFSRHVALKGHITVWSLEEAIFKKKRILHLLLDQKDLGLIPQVHIQKLSTLSPFGLGNTVNFWFPWCTFMS